MQLINRLMQLITRLMPTNANKLKKTTHQDQIFVQRFTYHEYLLNLWIIACNGAFSHTLFQPFRSNGVFAQTLFGPNHRKRIEDLFACFALFLSLFLRFLLTDSLSR